MQKVQYNVSVIIEMSFLLFGFLFLHLSNCESVTQSRLGEAVKSDPQMMFKSEIGIGDKLEELLQKVERMDISWKLEKAYLENKLEAKNVEVESLQKMLKVQLGDNNKEVVKLKNQVTEIENKLDEVMLSTQKNQNVDSRKS